MARAGGGRDDDVRGDAYASWPAAEAMAADDGGGGGASGRGGSSFPAASAAASARAARSRLRRDAFASLAAADALRRLRDAERSASRPLAPPWSLAPLAFVGSAGCSICYFGGCWRDAAVAGALGAAVALFSARAAGSPAARPASEFVAAAGCALAARYVDAYLSRTCLHAVLFSALIEQLQGWAVTTAVVESASRSVILVV